MSYLWANFRPDTGSSSPSNSFSNVVLPCPFSPTYKEISTTYLLTYKSVHTLKRVHKTTDHKTYSQKISTDLYRFVTCTNQKTSTYQSNSWLLICGKTDFIENNFSFFIVEGYLHKYMKKGYWHNSEPGGDKERLRGRLIHQWLWSTVSQPPRLKTWVTLDNS